MIDFGDVLHDEYNHLAYKTLNDFLNLSQRELYEASNFHENCAYRIDNVSRAVWGIRGSEEERIRLARLRQRHIIISRIAWYIGQCRSRDNIKSWAWMEFRRSEEFQRARFHAEKNGEFGSFYNKAYQELRRSF